MRLLREYVRLALEAAKTSKESGGKGLALLVMPGKTTKAFVIYDPKVFIDAVVNRVEGIKAGKYDPPEDTEMMLDQVGGVAATSFIKGYVLLTQPKEGNCRGAWQVQSASADKGYGPLLYDIAMQAAPSGVIMPDRGSTSSDAGNVWQFYDKKRGDVKGLPLDDIDSPKTPPKSDDCTVVNDKKRPWLDMAYTGSGNQDTSALARNHKNAVFVLTQVLQNNDLPADDVQGELERVIGEFADEAFFQRFTET